MSIQTKTVFSLSYERFRIQMEAIPTVTCRARSTIFLITTSETNIVNKTKHNKPKNQQQKCVFIQNLEGFQQYLCSDLWFCNMRLQKKSEVWFDILNDESVGKVIGSQFVKIICHFFLPK